VADEDGLPLLGVNRDQFIVGISEAGLASSPALVAPSGKHRCDLGVHVIVQEEPHGGGLRSAGLPSRYLDISWRELRERLQDLVGRVATLQISNNGLDWDAGAFEYGLEPGDFAALDGAPGGLTRPLRSPADAIADLLQRQHTMLHELGRSAAASPRAVFLHKEDLTAGNCVTNLAQRRLVPFVEVGDDLADLLETYSP
jgi:hypothetical protein